MGLVSDTNKSMFYNHQCGEIKLQKLLDHWLDHLVFQERTSQIQDFFSTSVQFQDQNSNFRTFQDPWEPCVKFGTGQTAVKLCGLKVTVRLAERNGSQPPCIWLCRLQADCLQIMVNSGNNACIKYAATFTFFYLKEHFGFPVNSLL